jgi:predicted GNAT family acetyltransferase
LYSRHTVVGAAATAAARPERTRAQEANEDNWKEFFDGNVSRFLTSQVIQAQLQQDYSVALQQQVINSVTQGGCSECGQRLQDCRLVRHVEVIVIDIATCCTVQVPVVECSR